MMSFLGAINKSFSRRLRDPVLSIYFSSWLLCNWNHLFLLFWGQGDFDERVNLLNAKINSTVFSSFNSFFWLPLVLSAGYLLALPWLTVAIKNIQKLAYEKLHEISVGQELKYYKKAEDLNIAKTRIDPDKPFLDELVKIGIERDRSKQEKETAEASEAAAKAEESRLQLEAVRQKEETERVQREAIQKRAEADKARFDDELARNKANALSNRLPILYSLMSDLEASLLQDDESISFTVLADVISVVFGYSSIKALFADAKFNNSAFDKVEFFYVGSLHQALIKLANKHFDGQTSSIDLIYDHIIMLLQDDKNKYILFDEKSTPDQALGLCYQFDFFNSESVIDRMAETDTIFEEINFDDVSAGTFDEEEGFAIEIDGVASGYHRKDPGVSGQSMSVNVTLLAPMVLGKYGLGSFEIKDIKAELIY